MTEETTEAIIKRGLRELGERAVRYRKYEDYYAGRHSLAFATDRFRNAFGDLFRTFADNLCPAVVDAVKDKLVIASFTTEEGDSSAADEAFRLWQANRMARTAKTIHKESVKKGDAYLIVWKDAAGKVEFYAQKPHLCTVSYDEETPGKVTSAIKVWRDVAGRVRLNLFRPDRIEKYITRASHPNGLPQSARAFDEYEPAVVNPFGEVPVFHFANNAELGEAGVSEIECAIPLQDALNKSVLDKMVAMEFTSFPQRYAIGLELEVDPVTQKPINPFSGVERLWATENENAKFGQFEAGSLAQFIQVSNDFRVEIARVTGTPPHYLMLDGANFPSGEALKTALERFVSKVRDRQEAFGATWEAAVALGLKMETGQQTGARLFAQWVDPAPASVKEMLEQLVIKQSLGASERQLLEEAGYGLKDIERMQAEKAAARASAQRAFDGL